MIGVGVGIAFDSGPIGGNSALGPYLPTVGASPYAAYGAKRMVSGYAGNLFTLRRADGTTQSFAAIVGDLPSYSAITTFAGGTALTVSGWNDQTGNGHDLAQTTAANQPSFSIAQALAGCSPILFDGAEDPSQPTIMKLMTVTGLSLNANAVSVFDVVDPVVSYNKNIHWEMGDAANIYLNAFTNEASTGLASSNSAGTLKGTSIHPRAMPSVIGMVNGATNIIRYLRETTHTTSAYGAAAIDRLAVGARMISDLPSFYGKGRRWGFVVYNAALSNTDALAVRDALTTMFSIPIAFTSRIVFEGDSIMKGANSEVLVSNMTRQLAAFISSGAELFNMGVSSTTMATKLANYSSAVAPLFTSAYGAGKCAVVMQAGTNDLGNNSQTASQVYTTATSYISGAHTTGFKVGLCTILPRGTTAGSQSSFSWDSSREAQRVSYNSTVTGNAATADFIVDVASDAVMGQQSAVADTTLYVGELHPTPAGQLRLAQFKYAPALVSAGLG